MTDQKPNCGNCPYKPEYGHIKPDCPFCGYDYTPNQLECMTTRCGCLSHPDARVWLMRDVIEELETLYRRNDIRGNVTQPNFHDGVAYGCEKAIALIKNGVEKK